MPANRKHPSDNLEDSVLRSLRQITRAIDIYSRKLRSDFELTGPQLVCLRHLRTDGPMTMSRLADVVSLSPATVSGILDRLERRGMIVRERQVADKRCVLVNLTAAGRKAADRSPPLLQDQFTRRFRALNARRQASLDRALRQVVSMMEADDIDASPFLMPATEPARSTRS